jgi:hypothetical protein
MGPPPGTAFGFPDSRGKDRTVGVSPRFRRWLLVEAPSRLSIDIRIAHDAPPGVVESWKIRQLGSLQMQG